jgi:hypothetical protein
MRNDIAAQSLQDLELDYWDMSRLVVFSQATSWASERA